MTARVLREIQYAAVPGYRPLVLDLHLPDATADVPVVLYFHGGGWLVGSRSSLGPQYVDWSPTAFERLGDAGFAVASVDYRLSGEATFPAQLEDVRAALDWVRANAEEHGLDTGAVLLFGESAGGHLAALLGLSAGVDVAGVADWYGPADLTTMGVQARADAVARADAPGSREEMLLGGPVRDRPELAALASPVAQVLPGAPPFLLVHGDADRFVPHQQSEQLAAALREVGVHVDHRVIAGADHMWLGTPDVAAAVFADTVEFLQSCVAQRPASPRD